MSNRVQYRRDTKARWAEVNPVLMEGEVGLEIDTKNIKMGDGVHAWNELEYGVGIENITSELGDSENLAASQKLINTELEKKFDKASIVQESGEAEDKVMSQKAVSDKLNDLVMSLKAEFSYKGIAQPTTNPGVPDSNVFYIAGEGTYTNFSGLVIEVGQLGILKWNGSLSKQVLELGASGGNMILNWNTDVATTRKQVLQKYRKPGVQISYKLNNKTWITEQYIFESTADNFFELDTYWIRMPNKTETEDLSNIVLAKTNLLVNNQMVFDEGFFVVKDTGGINNIGGFKTSKYLKVKENDVLLYTGKHYGASVGVAFYDKNFSYIGYWSGTDNQQYTNERVTCIANSAYARSCSNSAIASNLTYADTEPTRIDNIESELAETITKVNAANAVKGVMNLQYELVSGFYQSNGTAGGSVYFRNKELLPIEENWGVVIKGATNTLDSASALVFFNEQKQAIKYYKFICSENPIKAPVGSKYFGFSLYTEDGYAYLTIPSLDLHEKEFEEFKEKIDTEYFVEKEKNISYGSITASTSVYRNYSQIYAQRVYKDFPIRVKSVIFSIGDKATDPEEEQGVWLYAATQLENKKLKILRGGVFFNKILSENSINVVDVDFILYPNEIIVAFVVGGILKWNGTYTGLSNYNSGHLSFNVGDEIDSIQTLLTDQREPTSNNGGFMAYTYDLYDERILGDTTGYNFLIDKKIGVIGDSESVSGFTKVTWAKEAADRIEYSTMSPGLHWSEMICKRVGAILNNKGISGSVVFGDPSDKQSAMNQLENLDKDIDYLIVFTGTNGARLRDKNNVNITTLGNETSPKLSAMPTLIDSNDETFTICGALKWMIEYMYKLFPNAKIGFITPWAYQTRNDEDGSYTLGSGRAEGGDFAKAIRMICPLYSIPYFDNVKDSNICWFNDDQRHALMGVEEIVPTISQVKNFKIGANMTFYVKDENAIYKVLTEDSNHIPQSWEKQKDNSSGKAYGDGLHISNSNGHRYLSYKYENFIKSL